MKTIIRRPLYASKPTSALISFAVAIGAWSSQAEAASATVTVNLPVVTSVCTVTANASSFTIPGGTDPTIKYSAWQTANVTLVSQYYPTYYTSPSLDQTATVSCIQPTMTISAVVVQPSATASVHEPATQFLIDAAPTPAKAFGDLLMVFDQVSLNGVQTPASYGNPSNGSVQTYTTAFNTIKVNASSSTATIVWHPAFYTLSTGAQLGTATGGVFSGSAVIVISY